MKRKFIYKFPSRNRPNKFKHVLEKSINLLSGKHDVRFVITLDNDDETMNNDEMREWMDSLDVDLVYHYGDSKTKVEACNANLENEEGDILILVSDDMVPCLEDFDDIIVQKMEEFFPEMDGAIKFHDGLRPVYDPLMTLPVLGWNLYKKIGYIYHPDYTSVYCDNEMTLVCRELGKLTIAEVCIFRHEWTPEPFDKLHERNESLEMYQLDGKVLEERQKKNFDIDAIIADSPVDVLLNDVVNLDVACQHINYAKEEVNHTITIQNKSINLCMIVKDEAHIIKRCLDSVKPLIDKVLVVDTGSSDNTIQVINDWIKKENMTGKVFKEPWKGFAHNRTLALRKSQQIGCDYSLMIDADEVLNFNKNFDSVKFKQSLNKDYYNVPTKTSGMFYYRPTLTSNKKNFKYKAIIHEYLEPPPGSSHADISYETEFWNIPIQDSSRNKDPRKFHKDAQLLEEALATEKDDFLRSRYTFYLANSYRDAGIPHLALQRYLERAEMDFWEEERYLSYFEAARLKERLSYSEDSIISTFLKAQEHSPSRAEALHGAVRYCRTHNRFHLAYILGKEGINKTFNNSFLFSEMWIYNYSMADEFSIAAYWAGHYKESYDACQELLHRAQFPHSDLPRIEKNLQFAKDKLEI